MPVKEIVNRNPYFKKLFKDFKTADFEKIEVISIACDNPVFTASNMSNYIYILVNGICGMYDELENGEEYCYYKIANNDTIGIGVIPDARKITVKALTDLVALMISKEDLRELTKKYPEFYIQLSNSALDRLHRTLRKHVESKKYSSFVNMVSYLIYSYELYRKIYEENYSGTVKINETRQMISDFLGISNRSVNNSIEILRGLELIAIKHGKVYIDHNQYLKLIDYKKELLV